MSRATQDDNSDGSGASGSAPIKGRDHEDEDEEDEEGDRAGTSPRDGSGDGSDKAAVETEKRLLPPPVSKPKRSRFLKLDCDKVQKMTHTQAWVDDVSGALDQYRADIKSGVNPFANAFPLCRNQQFMVATSGAGYPERVEACAAMQRARGEETALETRAGTATGTGRMAGLEPRFANAMMTDAREEVSMMKTGRQAKPEQGTKRVAWIDGAPAKAAVMGAVGEAGVSEKKTLAETATESMTYAAAAKSEAPAAVKEGGGGDGGGGEERGGRVGEEGDKNSSIVNNKDPFLIAAAGAAAAYRGNQSTRSLMLGRRWYDQSQYPAPGGARVVPNSSPKTAPSPNVTGVQSLSGEPSGSSGGGTSGGSGGTATTHFQRPPRLVLYQDTTTKEVRLGSPGSGLQRIGSGGPSQASQPPHQTGVAVDDVLQRIGSGPDAKVEQTLSGGPRYGSASQQPHSHQVPMMQVVMGQGPSAQTQQYVQYSPQPQQPPPGMYPHHAMMQEQQHSAMMAAHYHAAAAAAVHQAQQQQQPMQMPPPFWAFGPNISSPAHSMMQGYPHMMPPMPPMPPGMESQQAAMTMAAAAQSPASGWPPPPHMWPAWMMQPQSQKTPAQQQLQNDHQQHQQQSATAAVHGNAFAQVQGPSGSDGSGEGSGGSGGSGKSSGGKITSTGSDEDYTGNINAAEEGVRIKEKSQRSERQPSEGSMDKGGRGKIMKGKRSSASRGKPGGNKRARGKPTEISDAADCLQLLSSSFQ